MLLGADLEVAFVRMFNPTVNIAFSPSSFSVLPVCSSSLSALISLFHFTVDPYAILAIRRSMVSLGTLSLVFP